MTDLEDFARILLELLKGSKELQHLEFLLVGGVGGGLGLQLINGNLYLPQQPTHLGGICIDV